MTKIIKKTTIENTTIVDIIDNNGYNNRVGVPFLSDNEQEIIDYINENYPSFDKTNAGEPTEEYLQVKYRDQRASEYPSIQEQFDMQYWDSINGTTTWLDTIEAIKTKYPKPE